MVCRKGFMEPNLELQCLVWSVEMVLWTKPRTLMPCMICRSGFMEARFSQPHQCLCKNVWPDVVNLSECQYYPICWPYSWPGRTIVPHWSLPELRVPNFRIQLFFFCICPNSYVCICISGPFLLLIYININMIYQESQKVGRILVYKRGPKTIL